ncbi:MULTISPECIES: hypothetical protein [Pacificimonas]|uniref:Uncharacterized protein n=1 Tax=Pacificimonas aurantium TaxID=1250540 RepID=A0ABS7WP07_9SPHN|nr:MULTISPECIES: hypothetical protein [Pacificimonas]MBZ6379675.1 hypothetical protein [Pacificimonas aurantium]
MKDFLIDRDELGRRHFVRLGQGSARVATGGLAGTGKKPRVVNGLAKLLAKLAPAH